MLPNRKRVRSRNLGQTTVEYLLMVAFGAIFSIQIARFFNDVFKEGLVGLEQNIQVETASGQGFQ
jgi:type II secretory pathway component PulJ